MQLTLAAFFWFRDKDRFPNFDALALSPRMGWLLLITAIATCLFFIAHGQRWRRLWLEQGDPRSIAVFRIVFGCMTLFNVNGLYEHWTYLFTEDGMFSTEIAQQVRAREQFLGYGDGSTPGEVLGFFDFNAFVLWLKGPVYSLLLFDSSTTFFWVHMVAFQLAMLAFIVGFQTRWTKWVAWFLFHSIILRNSVYWEGTENVYRCFLFYLCLSRCGAAYSVDNWLRCRRLRKDGRLSEPGGEGEGAGTVDAEGKTLLEPIYRAVPMWPRYLMVVQTAIVYGYAGPTKNGSVWQAGNSFYYSFNLDHFYRFPPQELSAIFGTNLFRLNTYIVHYWQMFFPLCVVGLVLRWVWREKLPPLSGWRLGLSRAALLGMTVGFVAMTIHAYPVHYAPKKGGLKVETVQLLVGILAPLGVAILGLIARKLWHKPPTVSLGGRDYRLDMDWFCRWFLGRRLWVGLGFIFHLHLVALMNIGWFNPGMMASYVCFLNGPELAGIFAEFKRSIARMRGRSPEEVDTIVAIPAQDAALGRGPEPHHRLGHIPLFTVLAMILVGVLRHIQTMPDMWRPMSRIASDKAKVDLPVELIAQVGHPHIGWTFVCAAVFLLTVAIKRRQGYAFDVRFAPLIVLAPALVGLGVEIGVVHMRWSIPLTLSIALFATRPPISAELETTLRDASASWLEPRNGFAYGGIGRLIANTLVIFHLTGLVVWTLPDKDSLGTFRLEARAPYNWWVRTTHTTQSWAMFAPNPPRSNLFLRELVYIDGEPWDLNTDVYACFEEDGTPEICDAVYPMPWIAYTRQRKMNRRIAGGEGGHGEWYQKWHARWLCREWQRTHDGQIPEKVELLKVTYPIPSPKYVAENGPYDPASQYRQKGKHKVVYTAKCATDPLGQLSNPQRARMGFEPVEELSLRGWIKQRCTNYNKRVRRDAIEAGLDPDAAQVDCIDEEVYEAASQARKDYAKERKRKARAERRAKRKREQDAKTGKP